MPDYLQERLRRDPVSTPLTLVAAEPLLQKHDDHHRSPLTPADRTQWQPLWKGYLDFYKTSVPPEQYDLTAWSRFHDPAGPMFVLGAFEGETMLGIVHYIFHRSCWTAGPYVYLQDLFTSSGARQGASAVR